MFTSLLAATALVGIAMFLLSQNRKVKDLPTEDNRIDWGEVLDEEAGFLERGFTTIAQPLSRMPALRSVLSPDQMTGLERRLAASGGMYGNSPEAFVAVQVAAVFVAVGIVLVIALLNPPLLVTALGLLLAFGIADLPRSRVKKAAQKRAQRIVTELPEFSELLLMPLQTGISTIPALQFTAERTQGVVSDEILLLVKRINASMQPDVAFSVAAARLGTPEAFSFLATLEQSYTAGSGVDETLRAQAESLRFKRLMEKKKQVGKVPTKIVAALAIHLLPLLLGVVAIPTIAGLQEGFL